MTEHTSIHTHDHGKNCTHDCTRGSDHVHQHQQPERTAAPTCTSGGCACGDGHDHDTLPTWPRVGAALALALVAEVAHWFQESVPMLQYAGMMLAILAIGLSGLGIYRTGLKNLLQFKLGINALMAVAVTGAFVIGQWPEAAMVMALYVAAERIEGQAMERARLAIRNLLSLAPDTTEVVQADGSIQTLPTVQVPTDAIVRVPPGARIPLDGQIMAGYSSVNQAPITGESVPVDKVPGDTVWAGSINQQAELQLRVTAANADSLLARIVQAVERAQASKAPSQRFVDRFAAIYTPVVMGLAVALAVLAPWLLGWSILDALYQALALLVIACPCALVLSTPITIVSALTAAARHGVLLKGGSVLEAVRHLNAVALDKTGTLTTGQPVLVDWQALESNALYQQLPRSEEIADMAWQLASRSDHPVSQAIAQGLQVQGDVPAGATSSVEGLLALPGRGIQGQCNGQLLFLVNLRWVQEQGLDNPALQAAVQRHVEQGHSISLLATDRQVLALFAVADTLRPQAGEAIAQLQNAGITPFILSGDHPNVVQALARDAGITQAQGGLLPQDKLTQLQAMQQKYKVAMVGDGINDAPALAQADVGFAMGGTHSTGMAMETADVVLMHDDLRRIPYTIYLSRQAHHVLWQNIVLALGIKLAFFALALTGHASMWLAVAADMGVSLLVVANGLRLRNYVSR